MIESSIDDYKRKNEAVRCSMLLTHTLRTD